MSKSPIEIDTSKCEIEEIDNDKLVKDFLENNHIQGYIKSKIKIGLFFNDELISLMIFDNNKLLRFCNKINTTILDSESLIFDYFIKKYQPKEINLTIDRSYTENFHNKLGFKLYEKTSPNCYYIKDFMRYKKLKTIENEQFLKIYDSGNLIYKFNI